MRLSDYVAARCTSQGIRDVFLVTGGGAMHLNDAFARQKALNTTCFHHEQAAAMAADGYYRLSNRPAVLNVTTGPGALNALNGVHGAYVDSLAIIVISGQVKRETIHTKQSVPLRQLGDQEVDIISIVRPLVKYVKRVDNPESIGNVLDKAFWIATNGRPGPVWIDIPGDVQGAIISKSSQKHTVIDIDCFKDDRNITDNTTQEIRSLLSEACDMRITEIINKLKMAKRPVVLAGTGVRLSGMYEQFHELIKILGVPVVTGWNAHDLLENDNPCFAGKPGTQGDRAGNFTVQNADFLIVLGCRLNIRQISYNWKNFAKNAYKVMVDIDRSELEKSTLDFDLKVNALLEEFIPSFMKALMDYKTPEVHTKFLTWCVERVTLYPTTIKNIEAHERNGINPYIFLDEFFSKLDKRSVVVTANGSACVMGFQAAKIKKGQRLFTNSGSASMGYDLPASIGASLSADKGYVYCLAGDGSIMMNLQELQTIVTQQLPIKIIILNNRGYASIRQTQRNYFPDNVFGTGSENDGLEFPDFKSIGKVFGISSIRVENMKEFRSLEVQQLLKNPFPALIDIAIDPEQQFSPKLLSRKLPDGTMQTPTLEDMAPFLTREELQKNTLS